MAVFFMFLPTSENASQTVYDYQCSKKSLKVRMSEPCPCHNLNMLKVKVKISRGLLIRIL